MSGRVTRSSSAGPLAAAAAAGATPDAPNAAAAARKSRSGSRADQGSEGAAAGAPQSAGGAAADDGAAAAGAAGAASPADVAAMQETIRRLQTDLRQLQASPAGAPSRSPTAALQASPIGMGQLIGAEALAALAPSGSPNGSPRASRFARREPRAQDLKEYDGASGAKLDDWLLELARAVRSFELNDCEAVAFGFSRLSGPALQWSFTLSPAQQAAIRDVASLTAALRGRFQPVSASRVAREQLRALRQGSRSINDYIADFQRLHAQLPDMGEADALFAFESGVGRELLIELRKQRVQTVEAAISVAAHIGSVTAAAASAPPARAAAAYQMDIDDGEGALDQRINQAVLNALQAQQAGGIGAKTQTQRGYQQERGGRGGRGGARGGRGGARGGQSFSIPGVPPEELERRKASSLCYRCGKADHRSIACPNGITGQPDF